MINCSVEVATKDDYKTIAMLDRLYLDNPWSQDMIEMAALYNTVFFVIRLNDNPNTIGYGSIKKTDIDCCEIQNICIDENFRQQGMGSIILQRLIDYTIEQNCNKLFLEVAEINQVAIKLYLKFGFEPLFVRNNYYGEKRAVVMQKTL